jgi:hypothetical protein
VFPVPSLFLATVDRWANQREIEIGRRALARFMAALEACRRSEGRYPEDPSDCLDRNRVPELDLGGWRRPEVSYLSAGESYALGVRGSDPQRDRSAVILHRSETGAWSWHDFAGFRSARGGMRNDEPHVACVSIPEGWSCRRTLHE